MSSKPPQSSYVFNGTTISLTWLRLDELTPEYKPITQVYGICFNDRGEILVGRERPTDKWQIPGGKPETSESPEQALARELIEEVSVKVKNYHLLGAQLVEFPNNPNKTEGDMFYQVRYICDIEELLPQVPDPDRGNLWERIFIPAEKITEYVKWGDLGALMFQQATELWKQTRRS